MKIAKIETGRIVVPLRKPFKTAVRTVNAVDNIVVKVTTDCGAVGYGEAAQTALVTGDTNGSIRWAVEEVIAPSLQGMELENLEAVMLQLDRCIVKNTNAKAAVDIALYDLYGQLYQAPLYKMWGGYRNQLTTDITISVNDPEQMARDSQEALQRGYDVLKIKVGKEPELDIARMKAIRAAVGYEVKLRIDANQGWKPKEAVAILNQMAEAGLQVELVEQPVAAHDVEGLKYVTDRVAIPVMADESVFSPLDAVKLLQTRAVDLINIKLMKTGGIHNALKICSIAEVYGVECMVGCMLETKLSVTAAVHLAAAKAIVTRIDLDGPVLCSEDPIVGGAVFNESRIELHDDPGFGFREIAGVEFGRL